MSKRPSLAETMRQAAVSPEPQPVKPSPATVVAVAAPKSGPVPAPAVRSFFAATRVGKKKVTAALAPVDHKHLKSLAVEHETTTEALLAEAIHDLFSKYDKRPIA